MRTHKIYAAILLALLVLTAGCSGFLGEDQSFEASEISVSENARSETGYQSADGKEYTVEETFGNDTEVSITSHLSGYETEYDNGSGYFLGLATPKSEITGVEVNPLGEYDKKQLVSEVISRSDSVDMEVEEGDLETVGNSTATVLETDVTVTTYNTTVERDGAEVEMRLHVTRLEHGEDYVIAVGVHPAAADGGQGDIITLLEGIEHDAGE